MEPILRGLVGFPEEQQQCKNMSQFQRPCFALLMRS